MRKVALVLLSAVFLATLFGCGQGEDVLFQVENVERIEAYRYDGVPAAAEKKIITDPNEIKNICEQLLSARDPKVEETLAGGTVISFRVQLKDETNYEVIYTDDEDLEKLQATWDDFFCEAVPAEVDELPVLVTGENKVNATATAVTNE